MSHPFAIRSWPALRRLSTVRLRSVVRSVAGRWSATRPPALPPPPRVEAGPLAGPLRADRRTKRLVARLQPGDIALIDHIDLDQVAAESLLAARVAAVLNARPSISGRYPNLGPELLVHAGVPLVDDLGDEIFHRLAEGEEVVVDTNAVLHRGSAVAYGVRQDADSVAKAMAQAREGLWVQLEAFAANTMEYLRQERELLLDGVGVPDIRTPVQGRHCLVVVRGYGHQADLAALRPYIAQVRPVLIGVDGGADALVDAGHRPDLIVGDMDSVSDATLRGGAELVVHAYPDGRSPGLGRLRRLNLPAVVFPAAATSEDIAMLLADGHGAELIVAVGGHATLGEFLDKGRGGMASTFLTRLKIGGRLVDAKGVSRLYRPTPSAAAYLLLTGCALGAMVLGVLATTVGRDWLDTAARWWDLLLVQAQGLLL